MGGRHSSENQPSIQKIILENIYKISTTQYFLKSSTNHTFNDIYYGIVQKVCKVMNRKFVPFFLFEVVSVVLTSPRVYLHHKFLFHLSVCVCKQTWNIRNNRFLFIVWTLFCVYM